MIYTCGNVLDTPFQFIAHQCNAKGVMGGGLALQIRNKYPKVYNEYRKWIEDNSFFTREEWLGNYLSVRTNDGHVILNLIGQYDYGRDKRYTDYDALEKAFITAINDIRHDYGGEDTDLLQIVIAIPYGIGCGLAGGDWNVVREILENIESEENTLFVVYKI